MTIADRTPSLWELVGELVASAAAGVDPGFQTGIEALGRRLLSHPPDVLLSAAQIVGAAAEVEALDDPVTAEPLAACLLLAAWHGNDPALLQERARSWLRLLRRAAALLDPRDQGHPLSVLARRAIVFAAVCDVLAVDPGALVEALTIAADAMRLVPGGETAAASLHGDAVELCRAARQPVEGGLDRLQGAAAALDGAFSHNAVRHHRDGLHVLGRAFDLLGDLYRAQLVRLALAELLLNEGSLDAAADLITRAKEGPDVVPEQGVVLQLLAARLLLARGKGNEAEKLAQDAHGKTTLGSHTRGTIEVLLADTAAWRGDDDEARFHLGLLVAQMPPAPAAPVADLFTPILGRLAFLSARAGEVEAAQALVARLQGLAGSGNAARAFAGRTSAVLAQRAGDPADARQILVLVLADVLEDAARAPDQLSAEILLGLMVDTAGGLAAVVHDLGAPREALVTADQGRGWIFRSAMAGRSQIRPPGELLLLDRLRPSGGVPDGPADLPQLRHRIIEQVLASPMRALVYAGPPAPRDGAADVEALSRSLPTGWALASIASVEDRMVLALTDGDRDLSLSLPAPPRQLLHQVQALLTTLGGRGPEPGSARWRETSGRLLDDLDELVAAPLLQALDQLACDAVALSAPAWVSALPLLALGQSTGAPLAERLRGLAILPGFAASAALHERVRARPVDRVAAALAAPDTRAPLTSVEARAVAAMWDSCGATASLDVAADQRALLTTAGTAGMLHIAAHGEWNPRAMARSKIVLADGEVDLCEIYAGLDLEGTDLVVLSACQTAVSSYARSGEALSLGSFMLMAGARSVVGSLWNVDDLASLLLMTDLQRRLAQGEEVAASLVAAQRALRSMGIDAGLSRCTELEAACADEAELQALHLARDGLAARGPTPFQSFHFWAPFLLSGLPGPVRVPRPGTAPSGDIA